MIFKAAMSQTAFMLKKRESLCVFYVLFFMVLHNFIGNVLYFQGLDILVMEQPMQLLLLSHLRTNLNSSNTLMLIQMYPILVVIPAGFSLAREYQRGTRVFLVSRLGNSVYQISKYLAVFFTTMIIFTVPFLLEILLNCVSFPLSAMGDLLYSSRTTESAYIEGINHYFMKEVYLYSPYLYAVLGTLFWGAVSGLLGVFTAAVSSLIRVKYNVFLFLPVFALLNLPLLLGHGIPRGMPSIKWYDYMLIFNDEVKSMGFLANVIIVLALFVAATVWAGRRKDGL
ncbi:MAG: hypothetical protein NC094_11225 [Bacteroidales bacterium]|nr:hypothetical protein [Lachnoclostridium sp.]MCM1385345.1 hypothetical protein [Lachnoclostridium sp.]MCM1465980.1 hypothetical protein [Bacteroidales bacterium]